MAASCDACGAESAHDESCRDCFEALLAYENERPAAFGAVHLLTVSCYFLQHPAGFPLRILLVWHELLHGLLVLHQPSAVVQRRIGRRYAGAVRVHDPAAPVPAHWPRRWTLTVHDVLRPGENPAVDEYISRARAWATATLELLDETTPAGWETVRLAPRRSRGS